MDIQIRNLTPIDSANKQKLFKFCYNKQLSFYLVICLVSPNIKTLKESRFLENGLPQLNEFRLSLDNALIP